MDTSASTTGTVQASGGNSVFLTEVHGDLRLVGVTSATGDVTLAADGAIVDGVGDNQDKVDGKTITLTSSHAGIGTAGHDLLIESSQNGSVNLYATAAQGVYLTENSGALNVHSVASRGGNVRLTTPDGPTGGNDLVMGAGDAFTAPNGAITLLVGDNVTFGSGSTIAASHGVTINGDTGSDAASAEAPGGVSTFNLFGAISGSSLLVQGSDDDTVFNIGRVTAGTPMTVLGNGASTTFNVSSDAPGNQGNLDGIQDRLTLTAIGGAFNRLVVSDAGGSAPRTVTLTGHSIAGFAPGEIDYSAGSGSFTDPLGNDGILLVGAAVGGNVFNVQGTLAGSTTTIQGGGAADTFNVSSDAGTDHGTLAGIQGPLAVVGGTGAGNRLIVSDLGDAASDSGVVVTANSITGFAPAPIFYSAAGSFTDGTSNDGILLMGPATGGNTFNVRGTLAGSTTMIQGGGAADTFNVSSDTGANQGILGPIQGALTVVGGSGSGNRLIVSDLGNASAAAGVVVTANSISGFAPAPIFYGAAGSFTDGSTNDGILLVGPAIGGNTFNVQGTLFGSTTTIQGGGAADTFNVSSDAGTNNGTLAGILGTLTVQGGTGLGNRLIVSDLGNTSADTAVVVTGSAISGFAPAVISYSAAGSFTDGASNDGILLIGPAGGGNTFNVRGTLGGSTTTILGDGLSDSFNVSSDAGTNNGTLAGILGALSVQGGTGSGNRLVVSDYGDAASDANVVLTATGITGFAPAPIFYAATGSFTDGSSNDGILLRGANVGGNTFNVRSTLAGSTTTIQGGGAADTVNVSSDASTDNGTLAAIQGVLTVQGGSGTGNRLIVSDYGSAASDTGVVVTASSITGFAPAAIYYSAAGNFTDGASNDGILLRGPGVGGNTFNVRSTLAGSTTAIQTGGPGNTVNVSSTAPATGGIVDNLRGTLTVTGAVSDTLFVDDTGSTAAKTGTLTPVSLTGLALGGSGILYAGLSNLIIHLGSGGSTLPAGPVGNTFTINDINPATHTAVDGGISNNDTVVATFAADFNRRLDLTAFEHGTVTVNGNWNGTLTDTQPGHLEQVKVGGSLAAGGSLLAGGIDTMSVGGNLAGSVQVQQTLGNLAVGGDVSGSVSETGTINVLSIGGSLTSTGIIRAVNTVNPELGNINTLTIGKDLDGTIIVSGTVHHLSVGGSVGPTASLTFGNLDSFTVGPDFLVVGDNFAGKLTVTGTLGSMRVAGSPGWVVAGHIGTLAVYGGFGPVVLRVTENGIERHVELATPANPFPQPDPTALATSAGPHYVNVQFFYESGTLANPQLTARISNGVGTAPDQYDFSLVTYNDAAKFNLARLDAVGVAGVRNVAVEGDVLTAVSSQEAAFFKVAGPNSTFTLDATPAGIRLPLNTLAGVGVRDYLPGGPGDGEKDRPSAAYVQAKSIQALAFGSFTEEDGRRQTGACADAKEAAGLLVCGTAIVPAADTYRVPFADLPA